jgi:hypothetical protein
MGKGALWCLKTPLLCNTKPYEIGLGGMAMLELQAVHLWVLSPDCH